MAKKAGMGLIAGLIPAVGLGLLARHLNQPVLFEAGERIGAIAASHFGGTYGQVAFQVVDAAVERVIPSIAGQTGGIGRITEAYS